MNSYNKNGLVGYYNYITNYGASPIDDNFYEALAWQGLNNHGVETDAFNKLSTFKKLAMQNSLQQYFNSTTKNCPK